jgi:hypothetical protein
MPKYAVTLPQEEWDRLLEILAQFPIASDAELIGQHIAAQLSVWHIEERK